MKFSQSLKTLREAADLMQRDLAQRMGVSPSLLSLVEAGRREPTMSFIRRAGRALGIPPSVLFAVALSDDAAAFSPANRRQADRLTRQLFRVAVQSLRVSRARSTLRAAKRNAAARSA